MNTPNMSYTLLSCYKRCKQRCKLQYFDKVIPYDKINHRPFIVGIVLDTLFDKWVTEQSFRHDWMEDNSDGLFLWYAKKENIIYKDADDKRKLMFKARNAARRLQDYVYDLCIHERSIEVQKKLEFKYDGFNFVCKLDMWFPDDHEICDLKITEAARYLDPFQLRIFGWAMENRGETVEKLSFLSPLMKKGYREISWTAEDKDDTLRELTVLLEQIRKREWGRTAKDCWGCPVVAFCEADFEVEKEERTESGSFRIEF